MTDEKKLDLTGPRIEVVDNSGKVIDVVKLSNDNRRHAERVDSGMQINLDHDRFYTRIKGVKES